VTGCLNDTRYILSLIVCRTVLLPSFVRD
jgi:hypothetical protein